MNQQVLLPQVSSGDMLGRYRIMRRLGRGGMGEVWLCEDQRLNRQVAVKTLPTQNQQDRTFIQRFEREAKAAAALNHPHVLPVHDYGKQPLAMECKCPISSSIKKTVIAIPSWISPGRPMAAIWPRPHSTLPSLSDG